MKLLFIHADHLEFEAKKPALKNAPQLTDETKAGRMEEALVMFFSVEKGDEDNADGVIAQAVAEVQDIARQVKATRVVVYPYAHLSTNLAPPQKAAEIGERLHAAVREAGFETMAAPFGWYKAFEVKAKGHPLSELSRHIVGADAPPADAAAGGDLAHPHDHVSEALKKETGLKSHWYVLTPEGELTPAAEFDFTGHDELHTFYQYETAGSRKSEKEPPHVKLMRELELVDYEPGSDPGNFRWYPKGQLVKRLLETRVSDLVAEAGGMRVETPIMYDYDHPALSKYLNRFPARQYVLRSDEKEFFLRFAACFGQYLIAHDMTISYKHLPLRLYELTHYSFRREQRGELAGLRRLRTFTMPDMHTLVADMDQAKEEFLEQFKQSMQWMEDTGLPYNAGVRFVRSFFDENRDFATNLAKLLDRPVLLEIWDDRFFYFVMKFEFNVNDAQGKAAALSTVQIDVENTERFGIKYVNEDGERVHPLLLHASLSGSIDRNLYAVLERAAMRGQKGEKPALPFWLAPTQVRFLPVNEARRDETLALAKRLWDEARIRADVDDRDQGVGRKIRDAEKEWVPGIIVYGDKEAESGRLPVRVRGGEDVEMTAEDLVAWARDRQGDLPSAPLPIPVRLSLRPTFYG